MISSFRRLGAGSFATVFVSDDRGGVVVKQVKDPATADILSKEHQDLEKLYAACNKPEYLFRLPQPHGFYDSYHDFAKDVNIPRTMDLGLPPHAMYVMQRIWPVSNSLSIEIRDKFYPEAMKQQPCAAFLARLYLGSDKTSSLFFNSENFPLYAPRIEQLGLPASTIAKGMGELLSSINFEAGKDGRDIEFVLCGSPSNPLSRAPSYSCIDFNQMRDHDNDIDTICSSITANDPYYPRPSSPYWADFTAAYLAVARAVGTEAGHMAAQVLEKLVAKWSKGVS
jgi:hypothetical protein